MVLPGAQATRTLLKSRPCAPVSAVLGLAPVRGHGQRGDLAGLPYRSVAPAAKNILGPGPGAPVAAPAAAAAVCRRRAGHYHPWPREPHRTESGLPRELWHP